MSDDRFKSLDLGDLFELYEKSKSFTIPTHKYRAFACLPYGTVVPQDEIDEYGKRGILLWVDMKCQVSTKERRKYERMRS